MDALQSTAGRLRHIQTIVHTSNGAVITLLAITGLTHREAYKDIFMVAVLFPILAPILLILLDSEFGSF